MQKVGQFTRVGDAINSTHRIKNARERRTFLGVVGNFGRRLSEDMARAGF